MDYFTQNMVRINIGADNVLINNKEYLFMHIHFCFLQTFCEYILKLVISDTFFSSF